jgi:hypothetical protein
LATVSRRACAPPFIEAGAGCRAAAPFQQSRRPCATLHPGWLPNVPTDPPDVGRGALARRPSSRRGAGDRYLGAHRVAARVRRPSSIRGQLAVAGPERLAAAARVRATLHPGLFNKPVHLFLGYVAARVRVALHRGLAILHELTPVRTGSRRACASPFIEAGRGSLGSGSCLHFAARACRPSSRLRVEPGMDRAGRQSRGARAHRPSSGDYTDRSRPHHSRRPRPHLDSSSLFWPHPGEARRSCNLPGRALFFAAKGRPGWGRNFLESGLSGAGRSWNSGAEARWWNHFIGAPRRRPARPGRLR